MSFLFFVHHVTNCTKLCQKWVNISPVIFWKSLIFGLWFFFFLLFNLLFKHYPMMPVGHVYMSTGILVHWISVPLDSSSSDELLKRLTLSYLFTLLREFSERKLFIITISIVDNIIIIMMLIMIMRRITVMSMIIFMIMLEWNLIIWGMG